MKLTAKCFRVLNYRNIDDSDWIPLERVTSFVGRNEAGKTALLKALHKFNPATEEPYNPQLEFPRERFTAEYSDDYDWPVCKVKFKLSAEFRKELSEGLNGAEIPRKVILTRYYNGRLEFEYKPEIIDNPINPHDLLGVLDKFAKGVRRLVARTQDQEEATRVLRTELAVWADGHMETAKKLQDLRSREGVELLKQVRSESNRYAQLETADLIEALQESVDNLRNKAESKPISLQLDEAVKVELPVFIYFENYGILDSAVYLPRFIDDLKASPNEQRVRTIDAMFKHVRLTGQDILELSREETSEATHRGLAITQEMIKSDQDRKDLRNVKLNSASIDISKKFSKWYGQRRHNFRYHADGKFFRIWVSDDRRLDVDIELESRSKGFQWFFSFYLVFLVESNEGHKDAILLLDEPGLHLHPTAQQELITFFERLSEKNQLIYTTHSPFLIDAEHIHRIRPVTEDDTGRSRVSVDGWPKDRETIFPLQAAAGYQMVRLLFQNKKNGAGGGYFGLHVPACAESALSYAWTVELAGRNLYYALWWY